MEKYIGLDVHAASCTAGVIDAQGKRIGKPHVLETSASALIEFLEAQPGRLHLCLEEGTQSAWLVEVLSKYVAELVVVHVTTSRGPKDDARDAFGLAERLRVGSIDTIVYKQTGAFTTLRQLAKAHSMVVQDSTRTKNRLRAQFLSRGVRVDRKLYTKRRRETWLSQLPASSVIATKLLFAQLDAIEEVRSEAQKALVEESRKHPMAAILETCPGLGEIRVAQLMSIVVAPDRFRTRSQFWQYCGLGIVTRSSSDWVQRPNGAWERAQKTTTRGLNWNFNRTLKQVFKGAATTVITHHQGSPLHRDYERQVAAGTQPNLAKLTLARRIAAIALAMWKHKEVYDPAKYAKSS
jgi:transposase